VDIGQNKPSPLQLAAMAEIQKVSDWLARYSQVIEELRLVIWF
jgi:hypothetical protein